MSGTGLPPLNGMEVAVLRSKDSRQSPSVDAMYGRYRRL